MESVNRENCVSLIDIINKKIEPTKSSTGVFDVINGKLRERGGTVLLYRYLCCKGDSLRIISKCFYCHKEGYFYIVLNEKNGERFTIESENIKIEVKKEKEIFTLDDL